MEVKMERDLFGNILFLALQQKIDMDETLRFPLRPFPLVWPHWWINASGSWKFIAPKQETRVTSEAHSNMGTFVIDNIFSPWLFKELPETFSLLPASILRRYM